MKKKILSVLFFIVLFSIPITVSAEVFKETFEETDQRNYTTTVEIPNLYKVTKVTASTGAVTYSVSGNTITLNFRNGEVDNSRHPTKEIVYNPGPVRTNVFSETYNYNINKWTGTLRKIGAPKVEPQDWDTHSCSVSYGPSTSYPSGTRTCTANGKSVTATMNSVSSSDTSTVDYVDSRTETAGGTSASGYCSSGNMNCSPNSLPSSIAYDSGGYKGTLTGYGYKYTSCPEYEYGDCNSNGGHSGQYLGYSWSRSYEGYSGTVSKTVYVQQYSTTFSGSWREYFDRWSQDYTGTITGPLTDFYIYGVEIEYTINHAPELEESSAIIPRLINSYSPNPPSFKFKIRDKDGDSLNVRYTLYSTTTGTIAASKTYGTWYEYAPTTLYDGTYTLKVQLNDYKASPVNYDLGTVVVDRTSPTLGYSLTATQLTSGYLGSGSTITTNITASEVLKDAPVVYLNGKKATISKTGARTYKAYTLVDSSMNGDKLTLNISGYEDLNGNLGENIERDYNYVIEAGELDPDVSVRTTTGVPLVQSGNGIYVDVTGVKTLQGRILNKNLSSSSNTQKASGYVSVSTTDPEGLVPINIFAYDRAGNYTFIDDSTDGTYAYVKHSLENGIVPTNTPPPAPISTPNFEETDESKVVKGFDFIQIYSDGFDPTIANANDKVILRFKPQEAYKDLPVVKLDSKTAEVRRVQGEEYEAVIVAQGTKNARVTISIASGKSIIGNTIPSSTSTTNGSFVDLVKNEAAQKPKLSSFKSLGTQGTREATYGITLEARVLVTDITDINLRKLRPLMISNDKHYKGLDFIEAVGNELIYRTVVDKEYTLGTTYKVYGVDIYDGFDRKLITTLNSDYVELKTYGSPKFVSHEVYTELGGTSGTVGQNFFVKVNAEYDMLIDLTRSSNLKFNGRNLPVHEITPAYVIFKGTLTSTDEAGYSLETSSIFRDIYGRSFPPYKATGEFKISNDPAYISSSFQTSNPESNVITEGDYVYLTLRTTEKAVPPQTVTIGGNSVTRKDLGDGYYLYTTKISSTTPEGQLKISVPATSILPSLSEILFDKVMVKRSYTGWESVTLTSSAGANVVKGNIVVLNATATSDFLENPTVVVGGTELTTYVTGNKLRANYMIDIDTPYGQLDFKISNVRTVNGSEEVTTVTSGGIPNHSTNSNYVTNVMIFNLNADGTMSANRENEGGTSRVKIDTQGQIVSPGIVTIYNEKGSPLAEGPAILDEAGALYFDFKQTNVSYSTYKYVIELNGAVVNSGGKEVPIYYMGTGTGTYGTTYKPASVLKPASIDSKVNGVTNSFVKDGDTVTIEITYAYNITEIPQTVIVGEKSDNVISTKLSDDKKTIIAVRKINSNIPDGLLELDLVGTKGISGSNAQYETMDPHGFVTIQKYRSGYTVPSSSLPKGIKDARVYVVPESSDRSVKIIDGIPSLSYGQKITITLVAENTFGSSNSVLVNGRGMSGSLSGDRTTWTGTGTYTAAVNAVPQFLELSFNAKTFSDRDASGTTTWIDAVTFYPKGVVPYVLPDNTSLPIYNTTDPSGKRAVRIDVPANYSLTGSNIVLSDNTKIISESNNASSYYYAYGLKNEANGNVALVKAKNFNFTSTKYPSKKIIMYPSVTYTEVIENTDGLKNDLGQVTIKSSDGARSKVALNGDKIYLTNMTESPVYAISNVTDYKARIAGTIAEAEILKDQRTVRSSITVNPNTPRGLVAFSTQRFARYIGPNGYIGAAQTETTDGSYVIVMDQLSVLSDVKLSSNSPINPLIQDGNMATLSFVYEEYDSKVMKKAKVKFGNYTSEVFLMKNNIITLPVNAAYFNLGDVPFEITVDSSVGPVTVDQTTDGSYLTYVRGNKLKLSSITSNNPNNKAIALNGNTITLTLEYEDDLKVAPVVQIAGKTATVSMSGKKATARIAVTSTDPRGVASIKVGNPVGNTTFPVSTINTSDKSQVEIMDSIPEVNVSTVKIWSSNNDKTVARVDDTITLEVTYAENINNKPSALINGKLATVSTSGNKATFTLKVTDDMAEGIVSFSVSGGSGISGGNLKSASATTDKSFVEIIKSIPIEIISYSITSNNANTRLAKAGDTITSTVRFNQPLTFTNTTISGIAASVTNVAENTYQFRMQVPSTINSEQAILNIGKMVGVGVEANNSTLIPTDGSSVKIDVKAPTVVKVTTSKQNVQRAETIKLNVEINEEIQGLPAVSVGSAHATVKKITGTLYEATVQIALADKDGYLPVKVSGFYDMAGNLGTTYTNSNLIYLRTPTSDTVLESIKIRTSTGSNKVTDGNTIYIDLEASSDLASSINAFVNGNVVNTVTVNKNKATLEYIISSSDKVGMVEFVIYDLKDSKGNVIENIISSTTDFSYADVYRNNTSPVYVSISSNNAYDGAFAKSGDTITVKVSSTKSLDSAQVTDTMSAAYTLSEVSDKVLVYTRTVSTSSSEGHVYPVVTSIQFKDGSMGTDITGASTGSSTTDNTSVTVDITPPVVRNNSITSSQLRIEFSEIVRSFNLNKDSTWTQETPMNTTFTKSMNLVDVQRVEITEIMDRAGNVLSGVLLYQDAGPGDSSIMITISGIQDGGVYSEFAVPVYTASSTESDEVTVSATLNGSAYVSGRPITTVGTYTLEVYAIDSLGNNDTLVYTFEIR